MDVLWSEYLLPKVGLEKQAHQKTGWVLLASLFSQNAFGVLHGLSFICSCLFLPP